jgi:site-specific DNA recombinase
MSTIQAAIYARVSSEQQAAAHTIDSQLAALRERVLADGLHLPAEMEFIDEAYSGATLVRPALERLRDLVAAGAVDRLYVHSPDRLARKYAYQVLLVDEFQRSGVEVVFLNRELGRSPEDDLLLQVQGMMAEYERAKIIERHRRGKRHSAYAGSVNVLCGAPFGYRYVTKHEAGGQARYEIVIEEARVVRRIFDWVGHQRLTIGEVCRRLMKAGELTRTGRKQWDRSVVWAILKNPAYVGKAAFGKTHSGPMRPRLRAQRNGSLQPRRAYSQYDMPQEEWISIPVPAIVDEDIFAVAQEQLRNNQRHAGQRQRGARYLLQGLLVCKGCGYAYYGKAISNKSAKGKARDYAYYRCIGTDAYRFGGERVCCNRQVRTDLLDKSVWCEARGLLENPERVVEEYRRRLRPQASARDDEMAMVETQLGKLRQGLGRLIDSYGEGLIEKKEFEPRITRLRERIEKLERQAQELVDEAAMQADLQLIIGQLEEFAEKVKEGMEKADWATQREVIRALVKRVEVDKGEVKVVFRVDSRPFGSRPEKGVLQHCRRGNHPALRRPGFSLLKPVVLKVSGLQPLSNQFPCGECSDGVKQEIMINVIECPFDVRVHHPPFPLVRLCE